MVKCSCYCYKMKTNCVKLISHPLKCHVGQGLKAPVPHLIWQPRARCSHAFQQTDVCAQSSDAQGRKAISDLCCPPLWAFILLLKPLGSCYPWQRYLARATSCSCQRIYKRKAKLHFMATVMSLQGKGTKQGLSRWHRYLLRGLQAGEQSALQHVCICNSTLLWEMWGLDSLRVTSIEGLKLWHEKYLLCARTSQHRSTCGIQENRMENFAQVFQVMGWSLG